jgi:type 1 glutamine amidotransferase
MLLIKLIITYIHPLLVFIKMLIRRGPLWINWKWNVFSKLWVQSLKSSSELVRIVVSSLYSAFTCCDVFTMGSRSMWGYTPSMILTVIALYKQKQVPTLVVSRPVPFNRRFRFGKFFFSSFSHQTNTRIYPVFR